MIKAYENSAADLRNAVARDQDVARMNSGRGLLERLALVTHQQQSAEDRDELALLSTRPWTLARGDAMLRRFL